MTDIKTGFLLGLGLLAALMLWGLFQATVGKALHRG